MFKPSMALMALSSLTAEGAYRLDHRPVSPGKIISNPGEGTPRSKVKAARKQRRKTRGKKK